MNQNFIKAPIQTPTCKILIGGWKVLEPMPGY